ncbi:MAG: hypothetical protein ACRDQZ_11595 [Mycobacteriales bacterium]
MLSADDYDSMRETIEVLSDTELLRAHYDGQLAIDSGDYVDTDQLTQIMREAGRLPK